MVDLGRQILRQSSRTDENGNGNGNRNRNRNGNSARDMRHEYCLIDRTEFHIWSFGRGEIAPFRPEN
jgi:hypothetical protein